MMFTWVGSKARIVDDVITHFPDEFDEYWEPFFGAGHVGFEVVRRGLASKYHFSDINPDLIAFWKAIKETPLVLRKRILSLARRLNKTEYEKQKRIIPRNNVERAARFYYLIKNGYRGLWRVNSRGRYNVAYCGTSRENFVLRKPIIMEYHELLKNVELEVMDYRKVLKRILDEGNNAVIYMDPPYHDTFNGYSTKNFTNHDHVVLSKYFKKLKVKKHHPILSNSNTPFIRNLYAGNNMYMIRVSHNASCKSGNIPKIELLIT